MQSWVSTLRLKGKNIVFPIIMKLKIKGYPTAKI